MISLTKIIHLAAFTEIMHLAAFTGMQLNNWQNFYLFELNERITVLNYQLFKNKLKIKTKRTLLK